MVWSGFCFVPMYWAGCFFGLAWWLAGRLPEWLLVCLCPGWLVPEQLHWNQLLLTDMMWVAAMEQGSGSVWFRITWLFRAL